LQAVQPLLSSALMVEKQSAPLVLLSAQLMLSVQG
jgi:hypothetical protein